MVVTFRSHPLNVVKPEVAPPMLMTAAARKERIEELCGAGSVEMLEFTPELRALTAREFMALLRDRYDVASIYLGFNHRFGSDRLADFEEYRRVAGSLGMEVILGVEELGPQGCAVSSSEIRNALAVGDVRHAAELLGRPYRLEGRVVSGRQIGRTIGFPTANIVPSDARLLVPGAGVYAGQVTLEDGSEWQAVVNIGRRPTVSPDGLDQTIEAYLIDYEGDLYGSTIKIDFIVRLRDEKKFPDLESLRAQIAADVKAAIAH